MERKWYSPEKSRGEGSSKEQKATEFSPLNGESVLDVLAGLLEDVKWRLREEVKQQGKWIFSRLEVLLGRLKEERIYPVSPINLAWNNVQLLTPHLSPYLNTDSLCVHRFPSFIQQSSSKQPSTHSLQSSCLTQMPLDPYSRITRT